MDCYCERLEKGEGKRTWVSFCRNYRETETFERRKRCAIVCLEAGLGWVFI
jgi:hypothetical protein